MALNNQSGLSERDKEMQLVVIILAIMIVGYLFWYFWGDYVKQAWLYYVQLEGYLTYYTAFYDPALKKQARLLIEWAQESSPAAVNMEMYFQIRHGIIARSPHNYILYAFLLILAFLLYRKRSQFRGVPTLKSLLSTEYKIWPTLEFIRRFDPLKHWNELRGVGRYMVSPFTYTVENKILKNYLAESKNDRFFDMDRAEVVMIECLGRPFTKYSDLTGTEMALLTMVLAKELDDRYSRYKDLMAFQAIEMSAVKSSGEYMDRLLKIHFSPVMNLLDGDYSAKSNNALISELMKSSIKEDKKIKDLRKREPYGVPLSAIEVFSKHIRSHAYVSTLIVGACRHVRRKGKFPPGRLVYLKPWDRHLFLLLNNSPYYVPENESPHQMVSGFSSEVMGVYAHFQHEVYAERALQKPYVYTAVTGIKQRLIKQNIIAND